MRWDEYFQDGESVLFSPHERTSHNLGAIFARTVWQSRVTFRQTVIVERLNVRHTYRHSRQPWASAGGTVECREKDQRDGRSPRIPTINISWQFVFKKRGETAMKDMGWNYDGLFWLAHKGEKLVPSLNWIWFWITWNYRVWYACCIMLGLQEL